MSEKSAVINLGFASLYEGFEKGIAGEGGRMTAVMAKEIFHRDVNNSVREKLFQKRLNREEAKEITDTVLDIIRENLEQGNDVFLEGFGAFRIKERKARNRLNIKKMRKVKYPPKLYVIFVPSARLEEAVKNLKQDEGASGKEGPEEAVKNLKQDEGASGKEGPETGSPPAGKCVPCHKQD